MEKHFLINCIEICHVRRQFFQINDLRFLFQDIPADNTLKFVKQINLLFYKIQLILIFRFILVLYVYAYMTAGLGSSVGCICSTSDQEVEGTTSTGLATFFSGGCIMKYFQQSFSPFC